MCVPSQSSRKTSRKLSKPPGDESDPSSDFDSETFAFASATSREENILVIGITNHGEGENVDDAPSYRRDTQRVKVLRQMYANVFTLAPSESLICNENHIDGKMDRRNVKKVVQVLQDRKLDAIVLEYVHVPRTYYCDKMLCGRLKETAAGSPLINFLKELINNEAVKQGCKVQFAVLNEDKLYDAAIRNFDKAFGLHRRIMVRRHTSRLVKTYIDKLAPPRLG